MDFKESLRVLTADQKKPLLQSHMGGTNLCFKTLPLLCPKHVTADVGVENLINGQKDLDLL